MQGFQKLVGADDATATSNTSADVVVYHKFTAEKTGWMRQFRVKSAVAGNIKCALYADNGAGTAPSALITAMNTGQAVTGTGWVSVSFTPTNVTSGTIYWLAFITSIDGVVTQKAAAGSPLNWNLYSLGSYAGWAWGDPAFLIGYNSGTNTLFLVAGYGVTGVLISAYIDFPDNPFATPSTATWTDVSNTLMDVSIQRGRQYELNRMEAGTAQVTLLNISGNYWPNNTTGAYTPNVLPWKKINIQASYASTTYDLYAGYIESWTPDFLQKPIKVPVMRLQCADMVKNLSQMNINSTGYAAELSGTRVTNILNSLGWPTTPRALDTGQSTLQATGALVNENAMNLLFTVQDSELGIFFISPSGDATFQDRHARLKAPYLTSQGTFGDVPSTDLGYTEVLLSFEDLRIYNDVRVTRTGGTEQVATSTTSKDSYGTRTLEKPSLLMPTDAEALAQAQYLLSRFENPVLRAKQITLRPDENGTNVYPKALGLDISGRITLRLTQASINKPYHIEGIRHAWSAVAPWFETKWMLTDAQVDSYWILGDAVYGVLGSTTKLAY